MIAMSHAARLLLTAALLVAVYRGSRAALVAVLILFALGDEITWAYLRKERRDALPNATILRRMARATDDPVDVRKGAM
jgi:hypothetical protein